MARSFWVSLQHVGREDTWRTPGKHPSRGYHNKIRNIDFAFVLQGTTIAKSLRHSGKHHILMLAHQGLKF